MKKLHHNHLRKTIYGLEQTHPQYAMRLFLPKLARYFKSNYFELTLLIVTVFVVFPKAVFFGLSILYLSVQLFKLYAVVNGTFASNKTTHKLELAKELPIYSILLPVYKEEAILPRLITAIKGVDYPSHLLDVKLLIEEDDQETMAAAAELELPEYVEIIKIPATHTRTKPKACNYGLANARGKYVVIYDAEDLPKSAQLRQVVAAFESNEKNVICIQAKLDFYNRNENMLTKLFSLEYGLLFNYILPGLEKLNFPIPLGGTSNHFIREKLIEIGGWDAFNVTEDADLGMRIYRLGLKTKVIDSVTLEEAPITYGAWVSQRTRWIKGHLLTSLLHLSKGNNLNLKNKLAIGFTLLLPNIAYILLPIYMLLDYLLDSDSLHLLYQINIGLGIILSFVYAYLVKLKQPMMKVKEITLAAPLYWFLLSIASVMALIEAFKNPLQWNKTEHGISKF